jgi:lysozyme family protein
MSPDEVYKYALATTLAEEGGYVNHPDDPGGATNKGVTTGTYDAYRIGKGLSPQDVRLISEDELQEIFYSYWEAIRGDSLPPAIAVVAFDIAVNSGSARLLEWLAERPYDHMTLTARRLQHYTALTIWPTFGLGWLKRSARVLEAAKKVAV